VAAGQEDDTYRGSSIFRAVPDKSRHGRWPKEGWLKRAVQDYRVLFWITRGTGRSTPVNYQTMARSRTAQAWQTI